MTEIDDGIPKAEDGGLLLQGGTYKAISISYFINQLEHLYRQWRKYGAKYWHNSRIFIIQTPEANSKLRFLISSVFHVWLFGVGFPETTIIFTKNKIHLLCKKRDAHLFGVLKAPISRMDPTLFDLELDLKIKSEEDNGVAQVDHILLNYVRENGNKITKVGYPMKDDTEIGALLNQLTKTKEYLEDCDVTKGISKLFIIKNQLEIETIEKSAFLNATVMNCFMEKTLRSAIANYDNVTHSELTRKITELVLNPTMINKDFIRQQRINICYPPTVQSGDNFDFSPGVTSNGHNLNAEDGSVVICSIGSSYDDYFSYTARTFLTEPTEYQKTTYRILLEAQEAVILSLRVGNTVNTAYESARQVVYRHDQLLLQHLTQSAGTGIGLEFNESILNINAANGEVVEPGMVFNVSLGFQNLVDDSAGITFSILLGDTVVVGDVISRVLTLSSKGLDNVTHPFTREESQQYQNGLEELLQGV